ncbi:hypothetical protein mRhiFer1_006988 [Rhinolophus ferrumequinum]|uniref:Uncharacterized protein n=1 Tax=Rhinolophus ferrumequinum TaxID=59479 RepID=A0A7J7XP16_RHIFE|nr:hypothetical protein mRhiFer1_006988 [Rhinolophus ferrumequinum]
MDLLAEPSSRWPQGAPSWLPAKELFWPLFWGYLEAEEAGTSLKGRAPGEEEAEEDDHPSEYSESEDQVGSDEEADNEAPGFSGATGGREPGWLVPGDWSSQESDSYGEHPQPGLLSGNGGRERAESFLGRGSGGPGA